ncbi:MAG: hypothetical protein JO060_07000 [Candidatus Eremiobacteraeota bacterium]|nr:hypothetical protein [Candidatus Eremiobacteraeota bacterium]
MSRPITARTLLWGLVWAALALGACSKGTSSSSTPGGPTPTPSVSPTVGPSSTPPPSTSGVAYLPDSGDGRPPGITILHFEEFNGAAFPYTPQFANFRSPVRFLAIDPSDTTALAVLQSPANAYTLLQGVLGVSSATIFPGGPPYDTSVVPPSPAPPNAVIANITGEVMLGTGNNAVGLSVGPGTAGILGVNQAAQQTPTYNGFVGFTCNGRTPSSSAPVAIAVSPVVNSQSGDYSLLIRTSNDLLSFSVAPQFGVVPPKYAICYQVQNTALGSNTLTLPSVAGRGIMAFSPTDPSRAFLGQVGTVTNDVAVVSGLPFAITPTTALALTGGRVNSVAVSPNGLYGAVATDAGLFVISGLGTSSLAIVPQGAGKTKGPYSPNYKGADGVYHPVANVTSLGFSSDGLYLAALVSLVPNSPGGGTMGTLVVLPFNSSTGVLAAPAVTNNNLPLTAYYQDVLTVR